METPEIVKLIKEFLEKIEIESRAESPDLVLIEEWAQLSAAYFGDLEGLLIKKKNVPVYRLNQSDLKL